MELVVDEERAVAELDDLDQPAVMRTPRRSSRAQTDLVVGGVDLPAVAMPLVNDLLAVGSPPARRRRGGRAGAQPHRAPSSVIVLLGTAIDYRVRRGGLESLELGPQPEHARGRTHLGARQAEADAEERHLPLARAPDDVDLALHTVDSEPSVSGCRPFRPAPPGWRAAQVVGGDPSSGRRRRDGTAVLERLDHSQARVARFTYFPTIAIRPARSPRDPSDERLPLGEVGPGVDPQVTRELVSRPSRGRRERHLRSTGVEGVIMPLIGTSQRARSSPSGCAIGGRSGHHRVGLQIKRTSSFTECCVGLV